MHSGLRSLLFRLIPWLAALALGAAPAATPPAAGKAGGAPARQGSHRLQAMDLVKVQVYLEPELDRELRVSRDYKLTLPLVGVVDVTNLSVRDAEALITALYARDLIVNPQVNITVLEYAPRTVNVLGAVNAPGAVAIPPEREMGLMDVIARAGGFTRLANRTRISLTRTLPSGEVQNLTINADQLMGGDSNNRWLVQDSDIVLVPERLL